jgi:hypothetical protein
MREQQGVRQFRPSAGRCTVAGRTELLATAGDGHSVGALDDGSGPSLLVVHPGAAGA